MSDTATRHPSRRPLGRPSPARILEKKASVLEAARRQFLANGYQATTMEGIARAADVTKRTLYLWHADKAALFTACVLEDATRLPTAILDPDEDLDVALERYGAAVVTELASDYSYRMTQLLLREGRDFAELAAAVRHGQAVVVQPVAARLAAYGLAEEEAAEHAEIFLAMCTARLQQAIWLDDPAPDAAEIRRRVALVVRVFLNGVPVHSA
jgi:TetR/AcrR family transcriptional regulator, mexJK operon transcriptional repressor